MGRTKKANSAAKSLEEVVPQSIHEIRISKVQVAFIPEIYIDGKRQGELQAEILTVYEASFGQPIDLGASAESLRARLQEKIDEQSKDKK